MIWRINCQVSAHVLLLFRMNQSQQDRSIWCFGLTFGQAQAQTIGNGIVCDVPLCGFALLCKCRHFLIFIFRELLLRPGHHFPSNRSKVSVVVAPLFLARAVNSIYDLEQAALYIGIYCALVFSGTLFGQGQTLIYLTVRKVRDILLSHLAAHPAPTVLVE